MDNNFIYNFYKKIIILFTVVILIIFLYFNLFEITNYIESIKNNMTKNIFDKNKKDASVPVFDLTFFYKNNQDEKIEQDISEINNKVKEFNEKNQNLNTASKGHFFDAIKQYEEIYNKISFLNIYAYLNFALDSSKEENIKFYSQIQDKTGLWASELNHFSLQISNLSDQQINLLLKDKKISFYKKFIENIVKYKKHRLSGELEKFSIEKSFATDGLLSKYYDEKLSSLRFNFKNKEYNLSEFTELLNDKDKKTRDAVGKIFNEELGKNIKEFTFVFNFFTKSKIVEDKWRKYETPLSSELLSNDMNQEDLNAMVNVIKKNYSHLNKYYKLKAEVLKLNKLSYFDRNVSIGDINETYPWSDAKDIVNNVYADFNPKMGLYSKYFFENNRVDAKIEKSKRSGAFCTNGEPFVFLNFNDNLNSVTTLAHEIGHAIQMKMSKEKYGILMSDAPLNLAEVASTFGEALVYNNILNKSKNNKDKIIILSKKIENALNTILRQTAFHLFEEELHQKRKEKELSSEEISGIWLKQMKDHLGEGVEVNENTKNIWAYISHFVHHPFYVHSYAFSDMVTYSLYAIYNKLETKEEKEIFSNKYIDFITDMSVLKYDELLRKFNLNPKSEEFWQNAIDEVIKNINSLEHLLKQEKLIKTN